MLPATSSFSSCQGQLSRVELFLNECNTQPDTFTHLVGLGVLKSGWVCPAPGDSYTGLGGSSPWITQGLQAMGLVQYSSWSQVTDKSIDPVRLGVKLVHGTEI